MQVFDPATKFTRSLAKVLVHEGGFSNYPGRSWRGYYEGRHPARL